jgi:hypothetical protein
MRKPITIGLKTALEEEIDTFIKYWQGKGYKVEHRTKGLPYNGVLVIT